MSAIAEKPPFDVTPALRDWLVKNKFAADVASESVLRRATGTALMQGSLTDEVFVELVGTKDGPMNTDTQHKADRLSSPSARVHSSPRAASTSASVFPACRCSAASRSAASRSRSRRRVASSVPSKALPLSNENTPQWVGEKIFRNESLRNSTSAFGQYEADPSQAQVTDNEMCLSAAAVQPEGRLYYARIPHAFCARASTAEAFFRARAAPSARMVSTLGRSAASSARLARKAAKYCSAMSARAVFTWP